MRAISMRWALLWAASLVHVHDASLSALAEHVRPADATWQRVTLAMLQADGPASKVNTSDCPEERTKLLSPSTACCYQKLVKNPNCCLDEGFKEQVRWLRIQRPGTQWTCKFHEGLKNNTCWDSKTGRRGDDLMTVPRGATCSSPRILYIHGGSWMYGSPTTTGYAQLASKLAVATGAVVFTIDYPLVPHGNFSTIIDAAVRGLQWLQEHGPGEACPRDERVPMFVAGDSSGGGSALSVVLKLRAEPHLLPGQGLAGAFVYSPWTNLMCNTPEYYTNAFSKIQSPKTFKDLTPLQMYVGDIIFQALGPENSAGFSANALEYVGYDARLQTDPIASPYFARPEDFSGARVPPLHVAVGASESILGDSVRVAYTAAKGGADVTVEIYNGMWHVFPMYSEGCGSGEELWAGVHAIQSTGNFVRAAVKAYGQKLTSRGLWDDVEGKERYPLIHYHYDPRVNEFSRVGELMPHTAAGWGQVKFHDVVKKISREPWYVVLPSVFSTATAIFVAGVFVGGLMDYGGREAYNRVRRVAEYRRKCVEVPVGYVNLDAMHAASHMERQRSFLMDFLMGVPEDVRDAWRVETVRAKLVDGQQAVDAARAENAAWRRMSLPGYVPPPEVPRAEPPPESLESGKAAKELIAEVEATGVAETWAEFTTRAKDGSIEDARRENLAWRMQCIQERSASKD